jgi:large conductance mechanosensitive channel
MRKFLREFRDFLFKTNTLALAIAVVLGIAVTELVTAIKDGFLMPLILGFAKPGGAWEATTLGPVRVGMILGAFLNFAIVALVVFVISKVLIREKAKPTTTKACPECLEQIPIPAKRCRACTSPVA